ncbi:alpha-1A adrenergic receptor-like [Hypanus sabinus]|uniref:alpha-1A adrenergic receptor-like n=1 Tax=Hypanus sabinus TaxID=79690 RepID=UPI0028C49456|nr:alpha-1A adrenergic receptor-like [Hypanus sabinus]
MGLLSENKTSVLIQNCTACSHPVNPTRAVVLGIVLGSFILFAILGNILVVLSVACHRNLQTVTNYFIINLAIADLLLSCSVLPFSATMEILGYWAFGRIFCNMWAAMDVLCSTASIMSLCVISIDRNIGVSYPLRHPSIMTEKRALLTLVAVWMLALVISVGPLFGWKEPPPEDETICKITEEPGYVLFSAFGSFYAPLIIILVMYCRVYIVAKRETKSLYAGTKRERLRADQVTLRIHRRDNQAENSPRLSDHGSKSKSTQLKTHFSILLFKFSREKKAAKTLGIVVGGFILCWLPFFVVLPVGSFFPAYKPPEIIFKITFWLGYFNSCINPIIYPSSNREFKKAFQNILKGQCGHRTRSSLVDMSVSNHGKEGDKDMRRFSLGSQETFYKVSKSDRVHEWKYFLDHGSSCKCNPNCRHLDGEGGSNICSCCTVSNHSTASMKLHTDSIGDDGDPV